MAKVRQHDGDLYVSGNLRVLGGIQNVKNSETVTRLATSEAAITTVEATLTEAVDELADIEVRPLFITVYKRSVAYPDAPVGVEHTGWSIDIPTGTDSIYMSGAQVTFDGTALIGSWYAPVRFTNAATLAAVLTNETHLVPTDVDGNFGNYASAETKLEIYEGSVYVSSQFAMGYTASAGVTVDTAYFTSSKVVHVTDMSVDDGYVDLSGVRSGTTITKRFSISKSKKGDSAPSYSISASTVVALVKLDGTINPPVINMSSVYQVGTTPPQPFEAVFRFLVNGVEQFVPKVKQSLYAWSGFSDILIDDVSEILLYNTPDIILPFNYAGQEALAYMTVEIWSPKVGSVPGEWLPDVLLDSQSVTFIADYSNYIPQIKNEVLEGVPRYLGRFNSVMPESYNKGDSWLVYDTDDQPYERGLYLYNGTDAPYRLTDAVGSTSGLIVEAMPDILWAVKNGYGDTAQYGAVTYIENLISNAIFTNRIQIGQGNVVDLDTTLSDLEAAAALDATTKVSNAVSGLQTQIDGKIETYYTDTDPNTWSVADRTKHTGDMWYATTVKTLKRYDGAANAWLLIEDQKALDAYADAGTAQATADGKLDIFNARPTSGSYKVGDLWVDATLGKMYTCTVARDGSGWLATDWVLTGEDAASKVSSADSLAKDDMAKKIGYADYADMVAKTSDPELYGTLISGGYINADLIEARTIVAGHIATGTLTATEINVASLFAQNVTATGTITGARISAGQFAGAVRGFTELSDSQSYLEWDASSGHHLYLYDTVKTSSYYRVDMTADTNQALLGISFQHRATLSSAWETFSQFTSGYVSGGSTISGTGYLKAGVVQAGDITVTDDFSGNRLSTSSESWSNLLAVISPWAYKVFIRGTGKVYGDGNDYTLARFYLEVAVYPTAYSTIQVTAISNPQGVLVSDYIRGYGTEVSGYIQAKSSLAGQTVLFNAIKII